MESMNWTCPYCNRDQATTEKQRSREEGGIDNSRSVYGDIGFIVESIGCANEACRELQLEFQLCNVMLNSSGQFLSNTYPIRRWQLLPESSAKPQPDYVPPSIVEDYAEACRIRDLSPKASATLARRCLQGMIRDFCGITGKTLFAEIDALRDAVTQGDGIRHVNQDTIEVIDHVRKIGNYGAHMEKDINLIIAVESHEAQKLIELIELLLHEWYVRWQERKHILADLKQVDDDKEGQKREPLAKQAK